MKRGKTVRLEDLTGGINIKDSPSEIEDKQFQYLENWNFEGNKLVSGKGVDRIYSQLSTSPIQALTKDVDNVWYIQDGNVYKDGLVEYKSNEYELIVGDLDGKVFSININGVDKNYKFGYYNNEELVKDEFKDALINDFGLEVERSGNVYTVSDGEDYKRMTFSQSSLVKTITLNDWDIYTSIDIIIDGVEYNIPSELYSNPEDALLYLESILPPLLYFVDVDSNVMNIARVDNSQINISYTPKNNYTYNYRYYGNSNNPSETSLGIGGGSGPVAVNKIGQVIDGTTYEFTYPTRTDGEYDDFQYTYTNIYGTVTVSNKKTEAGILCELVHSSLHSDYITTNIVSYPTSGVDFRGLQFDLRKTDLSKIITSKESVVIDGGGNLFSVNGIYGLNPIEITHNATLTITSSSGETFEWENIGVKLIKEDRYNLTVSSYGILIVSARRFKPVFIDRNGVVSEIPYGAAGSPTIGTIYKGKIILGGFKGNDNIVFSKTDVPSTSENEMIDFSGYSAGSQSISGGNKGEITGFKIGENGLYVFKSDEIWYTNSANDTGTVYNFLFNKITSSGAVNQLAIAEVGQETFYFDNITKSVRRLSYEQNLSTLRDTAVSDEIESLLKEIPDDNEGNNERYSQLITLSYSYPNLQLNYPTEDSPYVYYQEGNEDLKYSIPSKTLIYNVDNKSWTTGTDLENIVMSFKDVCGLDNGDIYKLNVGNTKKEGIGESKKYTEGDDYIVKKYDRIKIIGKIIPNAGETAILTIEGVDEDGDVVISESFEATEDFKVIERIVTYFKSESITFNIKHNGKGRFEIYDIYYEVKPTKSLF